MAQLQRAHGCLVSQLAKVVLPHHNDGGGGGGADGAGEMRLELAGQDEHHVDLQPRETGWRREASPYVLAGDGADDVGLRHIVGPLFNWTDPLFDVMRRRPRGLVSSHLPPWAPPPLLRRHCDSRRHRPASRTALAVTQDPRLAAKASHQSRQSCGSERSARILRRAPPPRRSAPTRY
jgi:hypothetical protein|eukprot:COSAG01_NODE_9669_length_2374_cov_3.652747_2_plen_178_part_00